MINVHVHSFQSRNKDNKITQFLFKYFSNIVLHIIKISGFFFYFSNNFFKVIKFIKFDKFYF